MVLENQPKDRAVCRLLVLVLAIVSVTSAILAQSNSAIVNCSGVVNVNGTPTRRFTSLSIGDKIETTDKGTCLISTTGVAMSIAPNSSVKYGEKSVEVSYGTVHIVTTTAMAASVSGRTVSPVRPGKVRYQIMKAQSCFATVTAVNGAVSISGRRELLTSGNSATFTGTKCGPIPPGVLDSRAAQIGAVSAVSAVGLKEALVGSPDPMSPSCPD